MVLMDNETAINLLGLAAIAYVTKECFGAINWLLVSGKIDSHQRYKSALGNLRRQIEPQLQLWWSTSGRQQALASLKKQDDMPEEIRLVFGSLLNGQLEGAYEKDPRLAPLYDSAESLAVYMNARDLIRKHKTPRFAWSERARRLRKDVFEIYEQHLDVHRAQLVDAGIDIVAFEKEFAPANS